MQYWSITLHGPSGILSTIHSGQTQFVLGTDQSSDVWTLAGEGVAPRHALVLVAEGRMQVEDLAGGTLVNGYPITGRVETGYPASIQVGALTLVVEETAEDPSLAATLPHAPSADGFQGMDPDATIVTAPRAQPAAASGTDSASADYRGRYALVKEIARGGMGQIYFGEDPQLKRQVAVKVSSVSYGGEDPRFAKEAEVLALLAHPNIVPIYTAGADAQGRPFYAMKLVRGRTLQAVLNALALGNAAETRDYTLAALLTIFRKVCDAMAFAHAKGILHRDLKPENIMVGEYGEVLVMDWGLAKILGEKEERARGGAEPAEDSGDYGMTIEGEVMGTPQYMSPEQAGGMVAELDARSDIYSLGGILYAILTLRPPIAGKTLNEVLNKVKRGELSDMTTRRRHGVRAKAGLPAAMGGEVPEALRAVTLKAMATDRSNRYAAVEAFVADIEAYQTGFATQAEQAGLTRQLLLLVRRHKTLAVAACLLVVATIAFLWTVTRSERRALESAAAAQRALAGSRIALADAEFRTKNFYATRATLREVPENMRDADWNYLWKYSDVSLATVLPDSTVSDAVALPGRAGEFAVVSGGSVAILRAGTGKGLGGFPPEFAKNHDPSARQVHIAVSPDGRTLAVGHDGKGLLLYDLSNFQKVLEWDATPTEQLFFSTDGKFLHQVNGDTIRCYDLSNTTLVWEHDHTKRARPNFVRMTPDGRYLLLVAGFGELVFLNTLDGSVVKRRKPPRDNAFSFPRNIAISPDGKTAVVASNRGALYGVSLENENSEPFFRCAELEGISEGFRTIRQLVFSADGRRFAAVSLQRDGSQLIRVFSHTGVLLENFAGGSGQPLAAALDPLSGGMLIAGPSTRLWDFRSEPLAWVGPPKSDCAFWGDDDRLFLASGGAASLMNLSNNGTLWKSGTGHGNHINCSQDGKTAAFEGNPAAFFKAGPGGMEPLLPKTPINMWVHSLMRLSPTGERVLVGSNLGNKPAGVYDLDSGKPVLKLPTTRALDACWVKSNRENIVMLSTEQAARGTPGAQETIVLFDGETGGELRSVTHPSSMDVIVASPDGKTFIEAGIDQRVRLRNAETLQILREFRAHDGGIISMAWSPQSQTIATGSMDKSVRVWNVDSGMLLAEFRLAMIPRDLDFSPSGKRLVCATDSETLVWDLDGAIRGQSP